jgi:flavin-dependent thymidylate synthase
MTERRMHKMKVTLLHATPDAVELLIFTKNTRLKMGPEGLEDIRSWPREKKMNELKYMSTTIPSSWEFADLIFCIEGVSRAFTHQLVRTRTASFAQQAMRIVDMTGFDYHVGPSIKDESLELYKLHMTETSANYEALIRMGAKPEDARGVLPTDILTNICMKLNLRSFSELVKKRMSARVQDEYAQVLKQMVEETLKVWPWSLMFIMPRHGDAFAELGQYLKEQLDKEVKETGKSQNETQAWATMKYLDILRQE